jgi:hypothetical protein
MFVAASLGVGVVGCSISDLAAAKVPGNRTDPNAVNTPAGAIDRYKGAIQQFRTAISGYASDPAIVLVGLVSDELGSGQYNSRTSGDFTPQSLMDSRNMTGWESDATLSTSYTNTWARLAGVRITAQDGLEALAAYAPTASPALSGHLHTLQGMAEVFFAEIYCSGIPLSNPKSGGGFVYGAGLTTEQVLEHAVAQFDTALALSTDSVTFLNFARVAKGRALLDLGRFDDAKTAVSSVPDGFKYLNYHSMTPAGAIGVANFLRSATLSSSGYGTMVDQEGGNGLNYMSANDPRVVVKDSGYATSPYEESRIYKPLKWNDPDAATPVVIADAIEARLIEAEVALKNGDPSWLTILNKLRTTSTTCTVNTTPSCAASAPAGTGGVAGLPLLVDPVNADARIDLVFRERAFWLYLTGHRLGDMRRLVRQYGRNRDNVFPVGTYRAGPLGNYGNDVNVPAPASEILSNPKFSGCINRDA